jgi:hypothetical protein
MQNKRLSILPIALTTVVGTTLLEPGTTAESGNTGYVAGKCYILARHIRVSNSATAASVISLYKGAATGSAAGTEFAWSGVSVPGNSYIDWYGELRLDGTTTASALTGSANPATLTLGIDNAEIGIA